MEYLSKLLWYCLESPRAGHICAGIGDRPDHENRRHIGPVTMATHSAVFAVAAHAVVDGALAHYTLAHYTLAHYTMVQP